MENIVEDGNTGQGKGLRPTAGKPKFGIAPRQKGGIEAVAWGDRPASKGDRPASKGDRPASKGDRPARKEDRPARKGDRPAYKGDRPASKGDRPASKRPAAKAFYPWAAATLGCMVVIFLFSSQDADASGGLSRCMTEGIYTAICSIWGRKPPDMASPLAGLLEVLLRKAAHLSVFFVFGVCTANAARQLAGKARNAFWISLCWCSAYAATDEWHQYFVPGRAGMWQDWAIDTAGALLGIGAVAFFASRRRAKA